MNHDHDLSGAAFAQQRAEEAEAEAERLRAERDAARAAAAAWKRSAKMWRAWGVMAERVVTRQKHIDVMGLVYFHARELSDD